MADLLNQPVDPAKVVMAAREFIELAARGHIGDDLVEMLANASFHRELLRLSRMAELTPWAFLDSVAAYIGESGHSGVNDVMLACMSPKLRDLLMQVRYTHDDGQRADALNGLRRDLFALQHRPVIA